MAGKYLSVYLHITWSTKNRRCLIDPEWRTRLHAYMGSVARSKNAGLIEINSQPDHVHSYIALPSTISIADLVNALKANSTRWIRQTFPNRRLFAWQEGYAAFSVSRSKEDVVVNYIRNQDEHQISGQSYWNCFIAMGSNTIPDMFSIECRTFGARTTRIRIPA